MIRFKSIHKHFRNLYVIGGVNLRVKQGEVVVVHGPSDSGKSTLIRVVNQLEHVKSDRIWMDGINVAGPKTNLNKMREGVGLAFQGFNLYPHLTVLENIILSPMGAKNQSRGEAEKKATELLGRVGLVYRRDALPGQLSDGQQQRVAITRGLAMRPHVILFGEPAPTLGPEMAGEVLKVMKSSAESGMTMMCVTHEMDFACEITDRVIFIDKDRVPEGGAPEELSTNPKHEHAKWFL